MGAGRIVNLSPHTGTVVITGIRDLHPEDRPIVEQEMARLVTSGSVQVIIFGGARGVDTLALQNARFIRGSRTSQATPILFVIVPATVNDQPRKAREIIVSCADEIMEMRLDPDNPDSYHRRNAKMLDRALALEGSTRHVLCLAFWDGKKGGTADCVERAKLRGIPVQVVAVRRA